MRSHKIVFEKVKKRGWPLDQVLVADDTPGKARRNHGNVTDPKEYPGEAADDALTHLPACCN